MLSRGRKTNCCGSLPFPSLLFYYEQ